MCGMQISIDNTGFTKQELELFLMKYIKDNKATKSKNTIKNEMLTILDNYYED